MRLKERKVFEKVIFILKKILLVFLVAHDLLLIGVLLESYLECLFAKIP